MTSPHTSCFYRELPAKLDGASGYDAAGFDEVCLRRHRCLTNKAHDLSAQSAQYWYNGVKRTARPFTADQDEARQLVGEFARVLLKDRDKHELEWDGPWQPNVAVANCYKGSKEVRLHHISFFTSSAQGSCSHFAVCRIPLGCIAVSGPVPDDCFPYARLRSPVPPATFHPFRLYPVRLSRAKDPHPRHHPSAQLAPHHARRCARAVQARCAARQRHGRLQAAPREPPGGPGFLAERNRGA